MRDEWVRPRAFLWFQLNGWVEEERREKGEGKVVEREDLLRLVIMSESRAVRLLVVP
jgi:hypothetical protein